MKTMSVVVLFALFCAPVLDLPAADEKLVLPPYEQIRLENGLRVLFMEQHEVPLVSFYFVIGSGSTSDPPGKEGLSSLTAGLLRKGAGSRDAGETAAYLDFMGARLDTEATHDYTGIEAEFLKQDLEKGLGILSDLLMRPTFSQEEFTKLRAQRIDRIRAERDHAEQVIGDYYSSFLFGDHPYGRTVDGSEESLARIDRSDVIEFHRLHYVPNDSILAVVGDFETADLKKSIMEQFHGWQETELPQTSVPDFDSISGRKLLLVDKPDATQTFFMIGNTGISRTDPDRVPVFAVNTLFGGRFTSMLNSELRIRSGLTYGARSVFVSRRQEGPFYIYTFTRNETTEKAIDLTLEVLGSLHEKGISAEDLDSAKSYIKGQYPLTLETPDELAAMIAELEFYGLDRTEIDDLYEKLDRITPAEARRVIQEHFPLENLVFVLIGKEADISSSVRKYAPEIKKKSISDPGF